MIKLAGNVYSAYINHANSRVVDILSKQPAETRDAFAVSAFEFGVEMTALAGDNGTVIALGEKLREATDSVTSRMSQLASAMNASLQRVLASVSNRRSVRTGD